MNKTFCALIAAASLALGVLAPAHATLLKFEDSGVDTFVPLSAYAGFNWTNARIANTADFSSIPGLGQSAVSGTHAVINSNVGKISFSASTVFSLTSGYFTSFNGSGVPLTISGYLNGNLVGTQNFTINNTAPSFEQLDQAIFGHVTMVTFNNYSGDPSIGNALGFDDLDVLFSSTPAAGGDVPEPASIALLTLGLLGLAGARRQRQA